MNGSPIVERGQLPVALRRACQFEPVDQVRGGTTYATTKPTSDRAEADEEPLPQLLEMLDERRLLAVLEATR